MVDVKTVEYVANLARINIRDDEKLRLANEMSKILKYIDKLKELDVGSISPVRGAFTENNVLREDKPEKSSYSSGILSNALGREGNYFKVPKVI